MNRFSAGLIALFMLLFAQAASAQQNNTYWLNYTGPAPWPTSAWTPASPNNPLPVNCVTGCSGGGGGGLSVQDGATFTAGTSNFTPSGCTFTAAGTLSAGTQGTVRCNGFRAFIVDVDTSNNNLYSALTAPVPCKAAATWNASTGLTGTNPVGCDGSAALWSDIGAVGGTAVGTFGATPSGSTPAVPVVAAVTQLPGTTYNTVAASQTTQALTGGSGGATGDLLNFCMVIPTSTSPGVVTILDNATTVAAFPGGASSISNLVPFILPVGSKSVSGAWKVTTGANLSVVCNGKFT